MRQALFFGGWCAMPALLLLAQAPPPAAKSSARPARAKAAAATAAGAAARNAATAASPAAGEAGPTLGLQFGAPRGFRPMPSESFKLANGLRVMVAENREIPQVNLHVLLAAGSEFDPEGKTGLAELTARSVRTGGTAKLSPSAVEELFGRAGATLESLATDARAQFSLRVPSARLADVAPVVRDLLMKPLLDPDAVDSAHGQLMDAVGVRAFSPAAILNLNFRRRAFGPASPLGRVPSYESLENTGRADVEAFHAARYGPNGMLAIEGDLSLAEAKALAESLFGSWPATPGGTTRTREVPPPPAATEVLFADRPDARLSGIVIGHASGGFSDATDLAAMQVICEVLAAGRDSRLARRVKEAGGFRAEWNAVWETGHQGPGEFAVRGTVEGPYTTLAVQIVKSEIEKLRAGQITDQEVEAARNRTLTRVALRAQSSADQLLDRALAEFHGIPGDVLARTYQSLIPLTRAEVVRAAAKRLGAEQIVVVAGSSTLFDKPLTTITAKVETIDTSVQAARPMKPKNDPEALAKGREAMARWQQAMGGKEKLTAIKDLLVRTEGLTFINNAMTPVKLRDRWVAGDIFRQDQEFSFSSRAIFYNGKIGWVGLPGMVGALSESLLYQVRGELFRLPFRVALSDANPARQVAHLGGNAVQITEGEAYGMRAYLDPQTGLPQRVVYRVLLGGGVSAAVEETYGEWKDYGDGIKWPSKMSVKRNGRRTDDLTIVEVKFNTGVSVAEMEKKP